MLFRKLVKNFASKVTALECTKTPKALGCYSKAIKVDLGGSSMIFCSGSIGLCPKTGELISDDVVDQTVCAMNNIKLLLE